MICAGAGIPLHFLAEPEGSTRTTAEAAGGPTYRHFEQRQRFFLWVLNDLLKVVVARRALVDKRVSRSEMRTLIFTALTSLRATTSRSPWPPATCCPRCANCATSPRYHLGRTLRSAAGDHHRRRWRPAAHSSPTTRSA